MYAEHFGSKYRSEVLAISGAELYLDPQEQFAVLLHSAR